MKLLRTKIWCWWDIMLLKWCCIFLGMVAGAYFNEVVMQYAWVILAVALLLAIRPAVVYFKE